MMRRLLRGGFVFCVALFQVGHVGFLNAQEEPYFALLVEPDATVSIKNVSNEQWFVEGYSLASQSGALDMDGWYRIGQQFVDNPDRIVALLGPAFLQNNLTYSANLGPNGFQDLGELGGVMVWNPGISVSIGKPFGEDVMAIKSRVDAGDISWRYGFVDHDFPSQFPIVFIPEPSGFVLATLALAALVAKGRRTYRWRRLKPRSRTRNEFIAKLPASLTLH